MVMTLAGRKLAVCLIAVAALAALTSSSGSAASAADAPRSGANGAIDAISCPSAGNCTAVGHLAPPSQKVLFTVTETHGAWGAARAVPGIGALLGRGTTGGRFTSVSCSWAGNCGAGGSYSPDGKITRAFVVSEKSGIWGQARQVTGLAALTASRAAGVESVSCPSAGNCSAGGAYGPGSRKPFKVGSVFLVSEKHGVWGKAQQVAGLAGLNTGHDTGLNQISCTSAGNCLAVGFYSGPKGTEPFAVTQKHGTWGKAQAFPDIIAENTGFFAEITSVWCKLAGNCTGVGIIFFSETSSEAFAISQKNGTWGAITGLPVPGGPLVPYAIGSLTCLSRRDCTASGKYQDLSTGLSQPFVVAEKNGTWSFRDRPGVAGLRVATLGSVICRSAGNCSAAGTYFPTGSSQEVFVSTERNGTWGTAAELPGLARLNRGKGAGVPVLSCGATGDCSLGGFYLSGRLSKPYLATQKNGIWGDTAEVKGIEP